VPRSCSTVDGYFLAASNLTNGAAGSGVFSTFTAPANVLKGFATLINVANGQAVEGEPVALENFQDANTILFAPGDVSPNLGDGNQPATTLQINNGATASSTYATSQDAVSHILSATNVINEYATSAGAAGTDWVVTFPTKHFYVDDGLDAPLAPFAELFATNGSSCDAFGVSVYDREEKTTISLSNTAFSPAPSGPGGAKLCYEVNVLTFNASNLLGAAGLNHTSVDTSSVGTAGWANVSLTNTGTMTPIAGATVTGLPVIGFAMTNRNNAAVSGNNRNYGTTETHTYVKTAF
jgi:hypothetical protein